MAGTGSRRARAGGRRAPHSGAPARRPGTAAGGDRVSSDPVSTQPFTSELVGSDPSRGDPAGSDPFSGDAAGSTPVSGDRVSTHPVSAPPVSDDLISGRRVSDDLVTTHPVRGDPGGSTPGSDDLDSPRRVSADLVTTHPVRGDAVGGPPQRRWRAGGRPEGGILPRLARRRNLIAAGVAIALAVIIAAGGITPAPAAEPTVQSFLLAWESGQYARAAAMTTGNRAAVARALSEAYLQLDTAGASLRLGHITQRGDTATAQFTASVQLAGGRPWTYRGQFSLRRRGAAWSVLWSPSVIAPGLRAGQRLAVLTTMPARAPLLGAGDQPLAVRSAAYLAGVRPGRLARPRATAEAMARATGLAAAQLLGQITAAPAGSFLKLVTLAPADYRRLASRLSRVPGLIVRKTRIRLFRTIAPLITGSVAGETASAAHGGAQYQPGATVGLSGLQQAFQRSLTGTPTIQVVVQGAHGRLVTVLRRWPGRPGTAVRTTIDPALQRAADRSQAGLGASSAAIVAVRAGSGRILGVAAHTAHGLPAISPLAGQYRPGQAFSVISTAALLATGFNVTTPIPCNSTNEVGGELFANNPREPDLGAQPPFTTDFAHACATAFAGLSLQLSPAGLAQAAAGFGIGAHWSLPLPSFAGAMTPPSGNAELAADAIGGGSVRVSPLAMALAAALVQSGTWHSPSLITSPAEPGLAPRAPFSVGVIAALRKLMRLAVARGAARAADIGHSRGPAVYGQVGSVAQRQGHHSVRGTWFVGFRGSVAFAVLVFSRGPGPTAAAVAGRFAAALPAHP